MSIPLEPMTTLKFEGSSDDTFGCYWNGGDVDHDDCANLSVRTIHVKAGGQRMAVTGVYGQECMWSIGIGPIEDDEPMPDWPMRWRFEGYSSILEIDVRLLHNDTDYAAGVLPASKLSQATLAQQFDVDLVASCQRGQGRQLVLVQILSNQYFFKWESGSKRFPDRISTEQ